ncbi:tripartite motif-containing protein 34-like isoform X3 [Ursus americanus]|uniref:tripartite motif-containing protein 34-like isoform X3 n=2 Tax=Ursus americanus TaxID=9643 RepID=UPI001E6797AF|nr:tripartite motif-containing protein 34-like isoform X3 [Ursus americanus]
MALKILNIQDEVSCPICLELLTESLTLDCGHSFCQACITMNTKEVEISPGEESSCPVCGVRFSLGNLWPNQHLVNIMERIREFKLNAEEELKRDLCVRHEEKLRLFCKEDRKVICWLCERSQEHRGHHTFLVEEVVKECQEKLQAALERLRKEQQEAEKLEAAIREERTSWKYQVQTERQRIWTEFSQLRSVLDSEEQRELQKLEEEEKRILDSLAEAETELAQQNQLVKELISDLEHRRKWSTVDLLQDMSGIMKWLLREEGSSASVAWKERERQSYWKDTRANTCPVLLGGHHTESNQLKFKPCPFGRSETSDVCANLAC